MAEQSELLEIIATLVDANLSFPPRDIEATCRVWSRLLADIPGELLRQAADDIILSGEDFPKLATIRDRAYQVKVHNGVSAAVNPFKPLYEVQYAVRDPQGSIFPPEIEAQIAEIEKRLGDKVMTAEQHAYIDRLTAPYLDAVLPRLAAIGVDA